MNIMSTSRTCLAVLATVALSSLACANAKPTLLERCGGIHKIAAGASNCINWETTDDTLLMDPAFKGMAQTAPKPYLTFALAEYLSWLGDMTRPKPTIDIAAMDPTHWSDAKTKARAWEVRTKALMDAGIGKAEVDELKMLYIAKFNAAQPMKPTMEMFKDSKSLYARLGGIVPISLVVNDFVDLLGQDPVQLGNPQVVKALTDGHISVPGLKVLVTEQLAMATGGPYKYTGRSMKESHKGLMVSDKEWASAAGLLKQVLDKYKVPAKEQGEIFAAISSMKGDIVGG